MVGETEKNKYDVQHVMHQLETRFNPADVQKSEKRRRVYNLCLIFWRQNVTKSKNEKHRIFRNGKFYRVKKFRLIPN